MVDIKILPIKPQTDQIFWNYIKRREDEFFFYLLDYKQYPQNTQLFAAVDVNEKIHGLFIIWRNQTIQLRGSCEAAEIFLDYLKKQLIDIREITGTMEHKELLERNFPSFKLTFNLYRMVLNKGEEKIPEKLERRFSPEILESSPASKEKIAAFLRKVDPIFWGEYSAADITMDDNHLYLAILDKNREFISLAGLWIDEQIGIISIIGTDPDFRNQGYATSIVASSVQFLFKHTNIILIHVRTDNPSAVHVYQKVGYKAKYEYIVIKMR